jgi:hypothetical protein
VAVDSRTGKTVFNGDGIENQVTVDPITSELLNDPDQAIDIVHNHPSSADTPIGSSLSPPDILTLSQPGERSVTAVLEDGSYFTASRNGGDLGSLFGANDFAVQIGMEQPLVAYQWKTMSDVVNSAVEAGKITKGEGEILGFHSMWLHAADEGLMDYHYHLVGDVAKTVISHQDVIRSLMRKLDTAGRG